MRRSLIAEDPLPGARSSTCHRTRVFSHNGGRRLTAGGSPRSRRTLLCLCLAAAALGAPLVAGVGVAEAGDTFL
jgi:hypothetical protein